MAPRFWLAVILIRFVCKWRRKSFKKSVLKLTAQIFCFCFPISDKFHNLERRLCGVHSSGPNFVKSKPGGGVGVYEKRAIATWNLGQHKGKTRVPVFRWSVARPSVQYRIISRTPETKANASVCKRCKEWSWLFIWIMLKNVVSLMT